VDFLVGNVEADRTWAEWLAWQVREAGFTAVFQGWDVVPGNVRVGWLDEAVRRARHVSLVVSQDTLDTPDAEPLQR
jgi:hypothetical protein